MNILRRSAALWLLMPLLAACLSLPNDEQRAADTKQQLMARHDELMARMDELYTLRQQLSKVPDTVAAGQRRRALLRADEAMMSWMRQYHQPADSVLPARALAYYASQQQLIDSVGTLMQQSADSARQLIQAATPAAN